MRHFTTLLFFGLILFGVIASPFLKDAFANSKWELYVSETQLFSVLMPGNPDENSSQFRIADGMVIQNAETLAFIDQRPYRDSVKNYIIKFDQTFGPAILPENRVDIIERELVLYEHIYQEQNAKTIVREIGSTSDKSTGNLTMIYDDIDNGVQAIQVKVIVTETAKFHQIFTGSRKDLDSTKTQQYFKSLNTQTGFKAQAGTMNEEWRRIESPFSLFAVKIPPVSAPYFSREPSVTKDEKSEKIGMVFTDPVWAQNLFYNVSGYQLDAEMSFDLAEQAVLERHIKRHGRSMVGIKLRKDFLGETPYIEANYAINPPQGYPYINHVRLRAMFLGNYLMVQEVVGPRHLVETSFTEGFFNLIEFSPKKAFQKDIQRHMNVDAP